MGTKIERINQIAKERSNEVFTSIYHLINKELLKECFNEIDGNKAVGLDKITKEEYLVNLNENLDLLVNKLKNKSFRPTPAKKVNIPKANGKLRGIAIANLEDKIVQMALKKIIEAIFEPKLSDSMFGFRNKKGCHDALKRLTYDIEKKNTNFIVEADIKGFFDNINHDKLINCLELHIKDPNIIRLVKRFLKAGIIENGIYYESETGTPQGSILSPVLANIYMYYMLVKLFEENIKANCKGFASIVNYADDFVCCFQYQNEAENFYRIWLPNRLELGNLELAQDKTRLIRFGKSAEKYCGGSKPETFDFLGFTHYCSKSSSGFYRVKRKTSKKKFKQKVKEYKIWIKANRNKPLIQIIETTRKKLRGHYSYYGITDNSRMIKKYRRIVTNTLYKYLNRRSQRRCYTWEEYKILLKCFDFPEAKIMVNIYAK